MSTKQVLRQNYLNSASQLFRESGLSELEFGRIYAESLAELERSRGCIRHLSWRRIALAVLLICCVSGAARPVYRYALCALQEYIYPGLRLLRTLSIPLVATFPTLTELYDETCLVQNPLFRIVDMECWPCRASTSVLHITQPDPSFQQHHSAPFVYKTKQKPINVSELKDLYESNAAVFDRDASKIILNDKESITPRDMFNIITKTESLHNHDAYLWRINRMAPAQLLRKLIQRPEVVPQMGQGTERFVLIDQSNVPLRLPDTECNFSFLSQIKGDREVELRPARECESHCKPLIVTLEESHLLWYNWWYWRPVAQPSTKNVTSIAYMGSYC